MSPFKIFTFFCFAPWNEDRHTTFLELYLLKATYNIQV